MKQVIGKLPIYIYYDSAIIGALDFIEDFYRGGKYYFLKQSGHLLLVIYKKSFYAIFSLMEEAKECIEEIMEKDCILLSQKQEFAEEVAAIHVLIQSSLCNPALFSVK